uniref:Uncharacterized protein n=1 Tax=Anguilla anguilla TaxID=7936 RepID=A0A0E9PUB1_ANGAN
MCDWLVLSWLSVSLWHISTPQMEKGVDFKLTDPDSVTTASGLTHSE